MIRNLLAIVGLLWIFSSLFVSPATQKTGTFSDPAQKSAGSASGIEIAVPRLEVEPEKSEKLPRSASISREQPGLVEPDKSLSRSMFITANNVNMRAGPGTNYRTVGQVSAGADASVIEKTGNWYHLLFANGRSGWVIDTYLSADPTKAARKRAVAAPSGGDVARARQEIIRQSIAAYPGSCPCPYNRDRAGRACGQRSAWSKPGGRAPICYESDISDSRLASHMARQRGAAN